MNKELKNSVDFINQQVGKKTGFDIPENYFKGIEEKVTTNIFLEDLPKENTFKTPSNYFDTFEDDLFSKLNLNDKKEKEVKVISIKKKVLQFIPLAAAASVLLFIGLNYFNTTSSSVTFDDITIADVESWYENGYGDTDSDELAIAFNETNIEDDTFSSITDENLEEYLNDIDNSDFINEIQ